MNNLPAKSSTFKPAAAERESLLLPQREGLVAADVGRPGFRLAITRPGLGRVCAVLLALVVGSIPATVRAAEPRVLVYTRNHVSHGTGYVHDNIAASVAMIRQLGATNGFAVDASDDPAVFTPENLKRYQALIFSNSNNEAFENDAQREVFKRYIQGGGGFVGIHSASGSERQWPYFWDVLGGKFRRHPPLQKFTIQVLDTRHPATAHLGDTWQWEDEFYFLDHLNPRMHVLLAGDRSTLQDGDRSGYPGDVFGDRFPLAWCQEFDGGRQFYTALGHKIEYYRDPQFRSHVLGGILWVLNQAPGAGTNAALPSSQPTQQP